MSRGSEYASAVSNLYQQQADNESRRLQAQANAKLAKAQIWGGTLSSLGQSLMNLPGAMRERKIAGLKEQELLEGFEDKRLARQKLGQLQELMQRNGGKLDENVVREAYKIDFDSGKALDELLQQSEQRAEKKRADAAAGRATRQKQEAEIFASIKLDDPRSYLAAKTEMERLYPDEDHSSTFYGGDLESRIQLSQNLLRTQGQRDTLANPPTPPTFVADTVLPGGKVGKGVFPQVAGTMVEAPPPVPEPITPYQQAQLDISRGQLGVAQGNLAQRRAEFGKPAALTPNAALQMTRSLRNDFVKETASATIVSQQLAQMQSSLDAVKSGAEAPGSQGVLVTFQKILDPTSVVRESEYARSASGLSLLARLEGLWMRIGKGGAGVSIPDLQQFVDLAGQFTANQKRFANESKQQIDSIAREYGLKPELITREIEGPVTVRTPDGQTFTFPDQQSADQFKRAAGIP